MLSRQLSRTRWRNLLRSLLPSRTSRSPVVTFKKNFSYFSAKASREAFTDFHWCVYIFNVLWAFVLRERHKASCALSGSAFIKHPRLDKCALTGQKVSEWDIFGPIFGCSGGESTLSAFWNESYFCQYFLDHQRCPNLLGFARRVLSGWQLWVYSSGRRAVLGTLYENQLIKKMLK